MASSEELRDLYDQAYDLLCDGEAPVQSGGALVG